MHNPAESIKLSAHELPMTDDPFWLLCLHFGLLQRLAHGWFAKQACKLRGKHLCCLLWETPDDEAQMHIHLCSLPELHRQHMQLQSLFESFEHQLDLPSCSVELDDRGSRPLLLR